MVEQESHNPLTDILKAASDPTRRSILTLLAQHGPLRVTEVAGHFDISLNAVSKHIKVLERAGLVVRTVDGRLHRCSLSAEPMQSAAAWLDPYRVFWTQTLEALAQFVEGRQDE